MVKKKPTKKKEVKKLPKTKKLVVSKPKKTSAKTKKLTPEEKQEKFWNEVEQKSHYLIADLLNQILPLPNLRKRKNLDLNEDADYRTLILESENNCSEAEFYPQPESLAEQIAYDYLLLVVKSLLRNLSDFDCHLGFEELSE